MVKDKKNIVENVDEEPKIGKGRMRSLITFKNVVIGIFAFLFIVQYFQIQNAFGTFSFLQGRDSSLITEIGQIKQAYTDVGADLKEVREFLRMPTKDYLTIGDDASDAGDDQNKDQLQLALFKYVDYLATNKNLDKNLAKNRSFLENLNSSKPFEEFATTQGLKKSDFVESDTGMTLSLKDQADNVIVYFYLDKTEATLYRKTILEKKVVTEESQEAFENGLKDFIVNNKSALVNAINKVALFKQQVATAINSVETKKAVESLKISIDPTPKEADGKIVYSIYNSTSDLTGEIVIASANGKMSLIDMNNSQFTVEVTELTKSLVPFISKLDTKTSIEKKVLSVLSEVQNTIKDKGFQVLLEQNGLTITEKYREDDFRYYFDLSDKSGNKISAIAIEKTTGVINIVHPDGTNSENLLFFDPEVKKKTLKIPDKLPAFSKEASHDKDTFNILIAGKNGSLVDTMIFAHINEKTKDIRMISIPRDLHFNGRKINAFANSYGMPELCKALSKLTGYQLDKYIVIDMYAFIDVVDLIGGVDVHLDKAVVDPTYKVIDNGITSTLHYEPGDYHLGGKQALRLARTRHTSSDFARAERQQMILEALQSKARNFGFGDSDTIYQIAKTVLAKTETDISLEDAIVYYFRYQNYDIKSNDVMSSGNILYSPPYITAENCAATVASTGDTSCQGANHAYILIPRDEKWDLIKWFFKEKFEA